MDRRSATGNPPEVTSGVVGPRTKFGRFKELHSRIEEAIAAGYSRRHIREWLAKEDISLSLPLYDQYLFRARQNQIPPILSHAHGSHVSPSETVTSLQKKKQTEAKGEDILSGQSEEGNLDTIVRRNEEHRQQAQPKRVRWDSTPKKRG